MRVGLKAGRCPNALKTNKNKITLHSRRVQHNGQRLIDLMMVVVILVGTLVLNTEAGSCVQQGHHETTTNAKSSSIHQTTAPPVALNYCPTSLPGNSTQKNVPLVEAAAPRIITMIVNPGTTRIRHESSLSLPLFRSHCADLCCSASDSRWLLTPHLYQLSPGKGWSKQTNQDSSP